ncbi:sulfatase family protein [Paenibacillus apiarius]|uniref:Sulfatase-like hydrolase/transferase n=1 Tax=Paenibacillus apiarius TaxID=46240 RepID=A0ABT4DNG7_9BACL|nr:sulfatase-like hydrolase/transferase [Paenibacillus apiarius]MCY9515496.1 sulfatase-like hydrolase/transferase [Paenibacillus apiarius]MCY9518905.1 sulfatase-like hydrolase/transferase [Paenibacillus apiarius]MCY9552049.1 sulfatase-like hydrolase/transferase [Paenibacillus apiarius]MCY9557275.1 sulfatase-like hydrolase/transferase [Paenibacillus apiarius]MCY9682546.1 sulfatase-like hydrolase/transferase [Paenibacillus apiarius]
MERKPNVIFIYCDDLGYGDLGCYGSDAVRTPHLDDLAEKGVRFTQWYSNSPVCSPSRASLLTGQFPRRAGIGHIVGGKRDTAGVHRDVPMISELLQPHGYRTAIYGKWHLGAGEGARPNDRGFDDYYGFLSGCVDYYSHIFYHGSPEVNPTHDLWDNEREAWNNGAYLTEVITGKSVEFIHAAGEEEKPFFLYVAYNAPHYPMHAPQKYMDRFAHLPWDRQVMAAMISAVDDGVGEIVAALKRAGLYDNTLLFFSSDNGPSSEARNWLDGREDEYYGGSAGIFRGHKASLFDGGIREPAILYVPDALRDRTCGGVNDEPVMMADMVPTVLDWADVPYAADTFAGRSLKPMLTQSGASPHERLYWEYGKQLAVREGSWKLVLSGMLDFYKGQPDEVHLSNLSDDPGERVNLAEDYPELVERLTADVKRWYADLTAEG